MSFQKLIFLIQLFKMSIMEVYSRPKLGMEDSPIITGHASSHIAHCYDYLRQSILCESDITLEGRSLHGEELGTDGWGATHVCKDHKALFKWAEEHQVKNFPL
jgi:hypothetical protein